MKRNLVYVLILFLLLMIGTGVYWYSTRSIYFGGSVDSVSADTIVVTGHLTTESGLPLGNKVEQVTLNIKVTDKTTLTRLALHIPASMQSFDANNLRQTESSTTLEVIAQDIEGEHSIGVEGEIKKTKGSYMAQSLLFRVPIFE